MRNSYIIYLNALKIFNNLWNMTNQTDIWHRIEKPKKYPNTYRNFKIKITSQIHGGKMDQLVSGADNKHVENFIYLLI